MNRVNKWILYLILLLQINFFSLQFIGLDLNSYVKKYISLFLIIILVAINIPLVAKLLFTRRLPFKIPIILLFVLTVIEGIWSMKFYGQSLLTSFTAMYYFFILLLYFVLLAMYKRGGNVNKWFKFIIWIGTIYSGLLIIQDFLLKYGIELMNLSNDSLQVEYGSRMAIFYRIKNPADFISFSILILFIFYVNNKFDVKFFLALAVNFVYIIFISQTRMYMIIDSLLLIILLTIKLDKINKFLTLIYIYLLSFIGIITSSKVILGFITGARRMSYSVRIEAINFYYNVSMNNGVLGIGFPNTSDTLNVLHGNGLTFLGYQYYLDDIGILGFIFTFGIFGVFILIGFILSIFKVFIISKHKFILLLPIIYVAMTSISASLFNIQRIMYLPFAFFIIYLIGVEGKNIE